MDIRDAAGTKIGQLNEKGIFARDAAAIEFSDSTEQHYAKGKGFSAHVEYQLPEAPTDCQVKPLVFSLAQTCTPP